MRILNYKTVNNMATKSSNIFDLLGIKTQENYHSKFICSLIEYDKCAKKEFLKMLNKEISVVSVDEKKIDEDLKCKARTERTLPDNTGRVDIFISGKFGKNDDNTRIIIENKIFASDQHEQIKRYFEYLDENDNNDKPKYKGYLFYLTLEGKDPSQYSLGDLFGTNKIIAKLSYSNHILPWLEEIKKNIEPPKMKTYISDYIEIVENLTRVSKMIKEGKYEEGEGIEKGDYNALLELRFWQYLLPEIVKDDDKIDKRRYFSYEKILRMHHEKKKNPRDYGIIVKEGENSYIRIAVNKNFELYLSKGYFDNDKWVPTEPTEPKITNFRTNDFVNITKMKEIAKEISDEFNGMRTKENKDNNE